MNLEKIVIKLSRALMLIMGFGLSINPVSSQPIDADSPDETRSGGIVRPGNIPLPSPLPEDKTPSSPIDIQTKEPIDKKPKTAYGAKLFVKEIKISGNTAFSDDELKQITSPYENRMVYNSELEDIRLALTRKYIEQGYINSGAIIPDHKVVDGVIQFTIIEGRLTDIEIVGNKYLETQYLKDRLKLGASTPLNVNELQEQIQLMLESPSVATINSALRPGDRRGEASLTALVKEGPRVEFNPVIDNRLSPTLGSFRTLLPIQVNSINGQGDTLNLSLGHSEGLNDASINWALPTITDNTINLFANYSDSKIVSGSFKNLNIVNRAQTFGFKIINPVQRNTKNKFNLSWGLEVRKNESELLGQDYAFTSGVPADGRVKATVIRFGQEWTQRKQTEVIAARSQFSLGINAFGATINDASNAPSGEFLSWLGQFQLAKLLNNNLGQIIFRANTQLTNDPLFGMEQYSIGGALSVRGYRENQLVRDTGYDVSLEYRYPLIKDGNGKSILTLAPFFDAGGSSNNKRSDGTAPTFISSVGLGFRWDPIKNVHAQLYWGHAIHKVVNDGHSLQDDGYHFLLTANLTDWL